MASSEDWGLRKNREMEVVHPVLSTTPPLQRLWASTHILYVLTKIGDEMEANEWWLVMLGFDLGTNGLNERNEMDVGLLGFQFGNLWYEGKMQLGI